MHFSLRVAILLQVWVEVTTNDSNLLNKQPLYQPLLVYLYFNRFMIPGKDVSMAGFVCIFIVLLKNLHMLVNFIAKCLNACVSSKCLRQYQEHYDSLKYFGSHRILAPSSRSGRYSARRKFLGTVWVDIFLLTWSSSDYIVWPKFRSQLSVWRT